ncbi:MAG: carboxypeptidase regulatory-like domain-containing protein [Planctomycetota bacterium]
MSAPPRRGPRGVAWVAGAVVLLALGLTLTWALGGDESGTRSRRGRATRQPSVTAPPTDMPELLAPADEVVASATVRGAVLLPDGRAAAGATVVLYRLQTSWPEWRRERVDAAITDESGRFQFGVPHRYGHLVEFERASYAGGLRLVPVTDSDMRLRLRPGYSIVGNVLNDVGAPVPNARVSLESLPRDARRARSVVTAADGSYRFEDVAAGPVRMVARHASWQPVAAPAVVIGSRRDAELRFERPTMPPLRGVVRGAEDGAAIEGARVELVPLDQSLGLVEAVTATTGPDGAFLVEGLPRSSMQLRVRHPDYGSVRRTQAIRATATELVVELPGRTRVRGQLTADGGAVELGGQVLQLVDRLGELAFATVDAEGRFEFDRSVSPGAAEMTSVDDALAFRTLAGSSIRLRLEEVRVNLVEVDVLAAPVVRGRFVDASGAPVAGVSAVRTQRLSGLGDAALSFDLDRVGGRILRMVERDELLAISGVDGRFELRGAKPGMVTARASGRGLGTRLLGLEMPAYGEVRELGDVALAPGCELSGQVLRGGRPFVGATVSVTPQDTSWKPLRGADGRTGRREGARPSAAQVTTDARGAFRILGMQPGSYDVRARIAGRTARSDAASVSLASDRPVQGLELVVEAGRVVQGVVENEAGAPLQDALVSVRGRPGEVSRTRRDGTFTVELPRRRAELIVSVGDRSTERVVVVARDQEQVEVQLDTPPTCTVAGVVVGVPGRRRLPGVLLRVTPVGGGVERDTRSRWVPTEDGELRRSQVPSGLVRLEFWCDGFAPVVMTRELTPNDVNLLGEVVLERGSRFRGVVLDEAGAPVAGAMALLGEESDFGWYEPAARSAADGSFVVEGVTSRSRQLVVRHPAFAVRAVQLELPRDVLAPAPVPIELARGGTIEVVVPIREIPDNGLVFLRRGGRLVTSTVLDERGYAWFSNRSPGDYSVRLASRDLGERTVKVKPGVKVTRLLF